MACKAFLRTCSPKKLLDAYFGSMRVRGRDLIQNNFNRFKSTELSRHVVDLKPELIHSDVFTPQKTTESDPSLKSEDYFGVKKLVTVEDLFNARVHLGHKEGLRNEFMKPYIYGNRQGVDVIDLDITIDHLHLALKVIAHLAYRDAILMFICRSRRHANLVEQTAQECEEFSHCRYWKGGMFTNSSMMYKSVTRLPDGCIFMNTQNSLLGQHRAVNEVAKMQILSVGIVDTNCDPRLITYPVPGNDDSPSAIHLYCDLFKKAILMGKQKRNEDAQRS